MMLRFHLMRYPDGFSHNIYRLIDRAQHYCEDIGMIISGDCMDMHSDERTLTAIITDTRVKDMYNNVYDEAYMFDLMGGKARYMLGQTEED